VNGPISLVNLGRDPGAQRVEELGGVALAIRDIGWQAEVIGGSREDTAAAKAVQEEELDNHFLAGVLRRELIPPTEATNLQEFLSIKENVGASHPRDLVADGVPILDQALFEV
jgi:hypothetical protein